MTLRFAVLTFLAALPAALPAQVLVATYPVPELIDDGLRRDLIRHGDVNGDGTEDVGLLVADGFGGMQVTVLDGATGTTLVTTPAFADLRSFELVGDADLDGIGDIAVVEHAGPSSWLYSGADGGVLWQRGFADCVRAAGDRNGDGRADILVARMSSSLLSISAHVEVWSGLDGAATESVGYGVPGVMELVLNMEVVGDLDGDGNPDLVTVTYAPSGRVYALSGADFSVLYVYNVASPTYGWTLAGIGDVDGDMARGLRPRPVVDRLPFRRGRGGVGHRVAQPRLPPGQPRRRLEWRWRRRRAAQWSRWRSAFGLALGRFFVRLDRRWRDRRVPRGGRFRCRRQRQPHGVRRGASGRH